MNIPRVPTAKERYAEYLLSEHWEQTRTRALYQAQYRCQSPLCVHAELRGWTDAEIMDFGMARDYRLEVHHLTYDRIGKERPDDLIVLCQDCHRRAHDLPRPEPVVWMPGGVLAIQPPERTVEEQLAMLQGRPTIASIRAQLREKPERTNVIALRPTP